MSSQNSKPNKIKKAIKKAVKRQMTAPVRRVKGRGGYLQDAVNVAKNMGKFALVNNQSSDDGFINRGARLVGEKLMSPLGLSTLGGNAGSWIARALGFGDYDIKQNSLLSAHGQSMIEGGPAVSAPPVFGSVKTGSDIEFSHREYIADVKSSIGFNKITYAINAGNPVLFPWMSQVARLFEECEFLGLILEYKPSSGTGNTSAVPGMGSVIMATDYDCYDDAFVDKRSMEAAEFSSAAVPYIDFLHPIECDPKRNVLKRQYVVPGIVDAGDAPGDQRLSVLGDFSIATIGQQEDDKAIGELWVTYHVRLSRPVLELSRVFTGFTQHTWGALSASQVWTQAGDSHTVGDYFTLVADFGNIRITPNRTTFKGRYKFDLVATNNAITSPWPNIELGNVNFVGCSLVENYMYSPAKTKPALYGGTSLVTNNGIDRGFQMISFIADFPGTDIVQYIQVPLVTPGYTVGVDVIITQVNAGVQWRLTKQDKELMELRDTVARLSDLCSKNEASSVSQSSQPVSCTGLTKTTGHTCVRDDYVKL